jgi:hypothetical protein
MKKWTEMDKVSNMKRRRLELFKIGKKLEMDSPKKNSKI